MNYEEPILINEEAMTEAFIPTRLLHREGQIRELERCLRPAFKDAWKNPKQRELEAKNKDRCNKKNKDIVTLSL